MFIKIKNNPEYSNAPDSFTIIDNVAVVNTFSPQPHEATHIDDTDKLYEHILNHDGCVGDMKYLFDLYNRVEGTKAPSKDNPYRYNCINFNRHGTPNVEDDEQWYFDTVAYIMSDDGKTIEKAPAGGLLNKAIEGLI